MKLLVLASLLISQRTIAADHPGNVFLAGEDVRVAMPKTWTGWRVIDIERKEVGQGRARDGAVNLGKLPIGYFEIREKDGTGIITAAVLAKTTTSENTPIAIDAAMSWFYSDPQQIRDACKLCRLA